MFTMFSGVVLSFSTVLQKGGVINTSFLITQLVLLLCAVNKSLICAVFFLCHVVPPAGSTQVPFPTKTPDYFPK